MAVSSRGRMAEFGVASRKWKEKEISPERNKVWIEPRPHNVNNNSNKSCIAATKVAVVYYLSRNGQLEHPHFMEVPLSSSEGLYLKDVINRLNLLRGKGMASLYSWSSKRSYKNGFVWHDLTDDDLIHPSHGQEYVLKGSEILDHSINPPQPLEVASSSSFRLTKLPESLSSENEHDLPLIRRRRNQSWSSIDLQEYKVYKAESSSESTRRLAADASTQTDDKRRRRKPIKEAEIEEFQIQSQELEQNQTTELSREDISPPPSDSSPETLESLMKADRRLRLSNLGGGAEDTTNRTGSTGDSYPSGRMKASSVLMQLISCGSISFKDCGPNSERDQGFSLVGHYKSRLPRGAGNCSQVVGKETGTGGIEREIRSFARVRLEDKEYFSGSLIETKKEEVPSLKRSSSYNADRSSQMQLAEQEIERVRAKCIPRKPKTLSTKKESNINADSSVGSGSKRHDI